ncbi:MAG: divalent-cation tolerance protein CutA [Candidatus Omnitrophica bacterium]|nr:divalent-cation tolerance protein CutA [Candidatus Omnitrophota bacterium]
MNKGIVVFVTVPCEKASELARTILKEKVAACVNIIPGVESLFWWEGKIDEAKESLLLIKTQTQLFDRVLAVIKENHPYTVPEIVAVEMDKVYPEYLRWICEVAR